jgi:hypothetical protein
MKIKRYCFGLWRSGTADKVVCSSRFLQDMIPFLLGSLANQTTGKNLQEMLVEKENTAVHGSAHAVAHREESDNPSEFVRWRIHV